MDQHVSQMIKIFPSYYIVISASSTVIPFIVELISLLLFLFLYSSQNWKNLDVGNDKNVPKAAVSVPEADQLIAPGTPIQFDIVLPATEFLDQNRGGRYMQGWLSRGVGVSYLPASSRPVM